MYPWKNGTYFQPCSLHSFFLNLTKETSGWLWKKIVLWSVAAPSEALSWANHRAGHLLFYPHNDQLWNLGCYYHFWWLDFILHCWILVTDLVWKGLSVTTSLSIAPCVIFMCIYFFLIGVISMDLLTMLERQYNWTTWWQIKNLF